MSSSALCDFDCKLIVSDNSQALIKSDTDEMKHWTQENMNSYELSSIDLVKRLN